MTNFNVIAQEVLKITCIAQGLITTSNSVNSNNLVNLVNQVSNQTISQGPSHNQTPAIAHLPPGEGSNSPRELYSFPRKLTALPLNPLNPGPLPQGKKTILPKPILHL